MEKEINELVNIGIELARSLKPNQEQSDVLDTIVNFNGGNAEHLVAVTEFLKVIFEIDQKILLEPLGMRKN